MKTSEISAELGKIGFTLAIERGPFGEVEENWPCISWIVSLGFNGRVIIETPYSMGIGHIDLDKASLNTTAQRWSDDEASMIGAWKRNPYADFKDKHLQAQVAAKLAGYQKVAPLLSDVLHSLLSDGEAYFSGQTFEQWAGDLGYDADSRKAEAVWKTCDATGRKLRAIPDNVLNKARELLQERKGSKNESKPFREA